MVVDTPALEMVALHQAKRLISGELKLKKPKLDWKTYLLQNTPFGRNMMFSQAKKTVDKASGGFYPAPYAILDVIQNNYGKSKEAHLNDEANKFIELSSTTVSEALIGIFQGTTAVKKHSFGAVKYPINTVGVLGAGLMGWSSLSF
jgi:hypothetical protein